MKVRFYRGPWDGKVKHIADNQNTVVIESFRKDSNIYSSYMDPYPLPQVLNTTKYIYYRTGHTHPDGSVFFEWDRPKGSRK